MLITTLLVACGVYGTVLAHTVWTATMTGTQARGSGVVVVLGAGLRDGQVSPTFQARLRRGAALLGERAGRGILSGGDTGWGKSEAAAAADWLRNEGLAQDWSLEDQSTSTRENVRCSSILVKQDRVLLVTSRTHLARSADLARRAGWNVELVAAEDRLEWNWATVRALARETTYRFGELVVS